jgi:hypothetical protein
MSYSLSSPALKRGLDSRRKFCIPLVEVDLSDLEDEVSESSADTLDSSQGEHGLALTVDVCVLDSENVNELFSLDQVERSGL